MTQQPSHDKNNARHMAPCPKSPNCVSSRSVSPKCYVEPLQYATSWANARKMLLSILGTLQRTQIVMAEQHYIHIEFRSRLFRFIDDVEFFAVAPENSIHLRSASRTGYWDMGVNRRRIEKIRRLFYQGMDEMAKVI